MTVIPIPSTMIKCDDYSIAAVVDGQYAMLKDFSKEVFLPPWLIQPSSELWI